MIKTVKFGGIILIIWGIINNDGFGKGRENGRELKLQYIEFLKEYLIPNLNDVDILQHGRDLYHQNPVTKSYLTDKDVNVLKQLPLNTRKNEYNKKVPNFIQMF